METPFKFLEAYRKKDRNLFFGRDDEIAALYSLVKKANLVVVYGKSGVGKTSLIRCGLASEFSDNEVIMLEIRRRADINDSLKHELQQQLKITAPAEQSAAELIQRVYNRSLKPVYLLFDQFEELFILGDQEEKKQFLLNIREIRTVDIPCVIILIIRQEYLGELTVFKKEVPYLFEYTLQINQMDQTKSVEVVDNIFNKLEEEGYTVVNSRQQPLAIDYDHAITPEVIGIVSGGSFFVELPYLQVYLDKLFTIAFEREQGKLHFDADLLQDDRIESIEAVINNLLDEQIRKATEKTGDDSDVKVLTFLKILVTDNDTKKPVTFMKLHDTAIERGLTDQQIETYLEIFTNALLLRPLEGNQYELSHDSVAAKIALKRSDKKRVIPVILGNPYKGLTAFTESEDDIRRFFGRSEATDKVLSLMDKQKLIVISGASGTGKSSLVKAGIFPEMNRRGYEKFEIRPGDYPLVPLQKVLASVADMPPGKPGILLLIDQYEELITRSKREQDAEEFKELLVQLIEDPDKLLNGRHDTLSVRIIVTIRADFEPQFKEGKLEKYWDKGRYVVPYMSARELEQVIENPAELAACYFDPPTLIRNIAEEVSGRPSALPLLSFALSLMYEASLPDRIITKKIYDKIGVFGALQTKANEIYDSFDEAGQKTMQEVLMRMVSFEGSEVTSRRVNMQELDYPSAEQNTWVKKVTDTLVKERLIILRRDENGLDYAEPAHDALLKGWTKLWGWIKDFGKENLYLRVRLAQAVTDYHASNMDASFLWAGNPWLDSLIPELNLRMSWLNRTEFDFVNASKVEREKEESIAEAEQQNKIRIAEHEIREQKKTIRKNRRFGIVIFIMLLFVVTAGIVAMLQRKEALTNLAQVNVQQKKVDALNTDLARKNKLMLTARDSLSDANKLIRSANDSMLTLTHLEQKAAKKAMDAANEALKQRLIALLSNAKLQGEVKQREVAQRLAELRGDTLRRQIDSVRTARLVLESKNDSLQKSIAALNAQKEQNVTQLVSISRNLEKNDMVKAYRVAELAYKKDAGNTEVTAQFRRLTDTNAYYYTNAFQGEFSVFSPDGKYILTKSAAGRMVKLRLNGTYKVIDSLAIAPDLISVTFSPSAQSVLLTYPNTVEIRKVAKLKDRYDFAITAKDIFLARLSADEKKLMIVANNEWQVMQLDFEEESVVSLFVNKIRKDEKIATAVFSDDGHSVITGSSNGGINIWEVSTGNPTSFQLPSRNIVSSYISSKGNHFMISTPDGIFLYDSRGKKVDIPNLQKKYGQLNAAVFSEDGRKLLLSMSSFATWLSQQQQQVQQKQQKAERTETDRKSILLIDLDHPDRVSEDLTSLIGPEEISSFTGFANIVIDKQYLFYGLEKGVIKMIDLDKRSKMLITGHIEPINSIGMYNGFILTSTSDNSTRIWQYTTASALVRAGLMPALSFKDMKELGIVQ